MFSKTICQKENISILCQNLLDNTKNCQTCHLNFPFYYTVPFSNESELVLKNCHLQPCVLKIKELFLNLTKLCNFPKSSTCRSNVHPAEIHMTSSIKKKYAKDGYIAKMMKNIR